MSEPYEEIIDGEPLLRLFPGERHERICAALHGRIAAIVRELPAVKLLPPRSLVPLKPGTLVRPDLALVTAATDKLWLAVEIINSEDHRHDTVLKKGLYEDENIPRLWMVDPRYDNLEVYHGSDYGLRLMGILAGREQLTEKLLPGFATTIAELFVA